MSLRRSLLGANGEPVRMLVVDFEKTSDVQDSDGARTLIVGLMTHGINTRHLSWRSFKADLDLLDLKPSAVLLLMSNENTSVFSKERSVCSALRAFVRGGGSLIALSPEHAAVSSFATLFERSWTYGELAQFSHFRSPVAPSFMNYGPESFNCKACCLAGVPKHEVCYASCPDGPDRALTADEIDTIDPSSLRVSVALGSYGSRHGRVGIVGDVGQTQATIDIIAAIAYGARGPAAGEGGQATEAAGSQSVEEGCTVCGNPTTSLCSRCKRARYCGRACQRQDWSQGGHKEQCEQAPD